MMNFRQSKESAFMIQPWSEQSSNIPLKFMTSNNFAKFNHRNRDSDSPQRNIEVGRNSVYFIKNNQEEMTQLMPGKKKHHRTAQNSPRNREKNQNSNLKMNNSNKLLSKTQPRLGTNKFIKNIDNPQPISIAHSNKQIKFQMKTIKKQQSCILSKTKEQFLKKTTEKKSNLKQIYQKSTMFSDVKLKMNASEQINEITQKRKLKTQKQYQNSNLMKAIIQNIGHETQPDFKLSKNLIRQISKRSQSSMKSKDKDKQDNNKVNFHLLMERKLFLLKNNWNKWQVNDINQSRNSSINRK